MVSVASEHPLAMIGEILDIIHNAILVINSENRIVVVNSRTALMFKARAEELQGLDLDQLFMAEDRAVMVPNIVKLTKQEQEFETEAMLQRRDGSTFLGLLSSSFFHWEQEEGVAVTIHDITQMKKLERKLKHSERINFLGQMLDDISHHIRNPVLIIAGFAKRLEKQQPNHKYLEPIRKEAARLETLLNTLNEFIKLPDPKLQRIPLEQLVKAAEQSLRPLVLQRGAHWRSEWADNLLPETVLIDPDLLLQALEAAVINSCEAYKEVATDEKSVLLRLSANDDQRWPYAIQIIDNGCGITNRDLPHVFSHFFGQKTENIGMGMTFAQRIMEEQQGRITIASTPGKGACVTFLLARERRRSLRLERM